MINLYLDTHIQLNKDELKPEWIAGLHEVISIPNEQKDRAIKEHVWGATSLPDNISLVENENSYIYLPRGFEKELKSHLDKADRDYKTIDATIYKPYDDQIFPSEPKFKQGQLEAIEKIISHRQGIINAAPGKGKTVIGLGAISKLKARTLIIVDKKNIAQQWIDRGKEHFDLDVGFIGDGVWDEKFITVALQQTLWSRFEKLDKKFWNSFSVVIADECHHLSSNTLQQIVSRFPAAYRIGLSATPGKTPAKERLSELILGPILYEDHSLDVSPKVIKRYTGFEFDYQPTEKIGRKVKRNNYQMLVKELVQDKERNLLVASDIIKNVENCNLIVSSRLNHLNNLRALTIYLGFPEERCWMLTGKESLDERMEVYEKADKAKCAIFSTIANEALDIPRLDCLYICFPSRNPQTLKQIVGRLTRPHEDKSEALIYHYIDENIGILNSQWQTALRKLYQPLKLEVA